MTIQKPYGISLTNAVVDTNNPVPISWKTSGDTSASFSISVYKNSDGTLIYTLPRIYSFAMSYTIPAGVIPSGQVYQIAITVWNKSSQSATSQLVVFTALSTPVVTVDAIETVTNNTYTFTANYSQAENDPLSTYTVNLYNSDKILLNSSGKLTDGLMSYIFDSLKSGSTYYIEFVATCNKGVTSSSGLVLFNVLYDNPNIYFEASAVNLPENASIKLDWNIRQILGKSTIEPIFIGGKEIDLTNNGKVFFDEGFNINDDFTLKLWFRNIILNTDLLTLKGSNGNMRLQYKSTDNCFHIYKTVNNWNYHYTYSFDISYGGVFISPYQYIESTSNKDIFLSIQNKNGRVDMYAENTGNSNLQGVTFEQLSGITFDYLDDDTFS